MSENKKQNSRYTPLIVADILPPRSPDIQLTANRPTSLPKQRKPAKEMPVRRPGGGGTTPQKQIGDTHAVDAWFRKERKPSSSHAVSSVLTTHGNKKKLVLFWAVLFLFLAAGGYGVSYMMRRIEVLITLKTESHDINQRISVAAKPNKENILAGERVELTDSATETFQATGTDDVRAKAKGVISIYNAYQASPQPLVANTRFETPDGKIYRIREAVTIPAAVLENGVLSPRSIDAVVYADQPGSEYNRESFDFTIPGFKGSPRYKGFYARSKTPLEGGYIGATTVVTKKDLDRARESLEPRVRSRLMDSLKKSVPDGFILLEDAVEITSDTREFSHEAGNVAKEFTLTAAMRARALAFKKSDFSEFIAKSAGLDHAVVSLHNPADIALVVEQRNMETGTLLLNSTGKAVFVWYLDTNALTTDLMGSRTPDMFTGIFQKYPAISRAEARFIPSWVRMMPRDPARVTITTSF